jgi:hypothetical protein
MKKRLLSFVLTIVLVLSLSVSVSAVARPCSVAGILQMCRCDNGVDRPDTR